MKPEILEHQIAHASYLTVERLRMRLTDGACRSRTDRRRKATDSGSCATPAATRPLRLGYFFCFWFSLSRSYARSLFGPDSAVLSSSTARANAREPIRHWACSPERRAKARSSPICRQSMHTKAIAPSRECAAAWPILNEDLLGTQPLTVRHISSASPAALRTQLAKDNCTNSLLNYGAELVASYGPFSIQERIWACTTRSRRGKGLVVRCPGAAPRSTSAVTTSMRLGTGPR